MAISGGIAAAGAIGGALITSNASSNAANTEANAANNASQTQWNMFQQQQANAQPWMQSGQQNLATLNAQMANGSLTNAMTMQQFQQDPGYQFQLQQGQNAINRSAASRGLLNSVGTEQTLDAYTQGMANTDYQQALQNFTANQQQRYNMLSGLSQQGLQATGMTNAAGANAANNISSNQMASGNAQAAGIMGQANATTGAMTSLGNTAMGYGLMNQLQQNGQTPNVYGTSNPGLGMSMVQPGGMSQLPASADNAGITGMMVG
jgi:hypothetical protein